MTRSGRSVCGGSTSEQRIHGEWVGSLKCEVIFGFYAYLSESLFIDLKIYLVGGTGFEPVTSTV